jgi:Domain of unknown function (DUF4440)
MKKRNRSLFIILTLIVFGCASSKENKSSSQKIYIPVSQELYAEIAHMDSVLFTAFNNRDTTTLKTLFTTDLEFYHDKGGLTGYKQNMEAFKTTAAANTDLRRDLIPGSLEVFPVKDYGAIQVGMHRFCHTENGKPDCGTFKFVHIWKKKDGEWKISRVVSYDH